ncbi:MAG: DUF2281 domain-containing protein [Cytophagales bacterium]|nr:MAG: DUF2281 domain-containing protein [Cytophagales bacterium]
MENTSLIQLYQVLPQNLKQEVLDFIYFLLAKYDIQVPTKPEEPTKRHSYFGNAKGEVIMHDNFDEPLEEFAEYR